MSSHPEKMPGMGEEKEAVSAETIHTDARARPFDGIKDDAGKVRLSLVPPAAIVALARVREFGVAKYTDQDSWRLVDDERYIDAALRHILAHIDGEALDPDSGLPHLDHAMCSLALIAGKRERTVNVSGACPVKRQAI